MTIIDNVFYPFPSIEARTPAHAAADAYLLFLQNGYDADYIKSVRADGWVSDIEWWINHEAEEFESDGDEQFPHADVDPADVAAVLIEATKGKRPAQIMDYGAPQYRKQEGWSKRGGSWFREHN